MRLKDWYLMINESPHDGTISMPLPNDLKLAAVIAGRRQQRNMAQFVRRAIAEAAFKELGSEYEFGGNLGEIEMGFDVHENLDCTYLPVAIPDVAINNSIDLHLHVGRDRLVEFVAEFNESSQNNPVRPVSEALAYLGAVLVTEIGEQFGGDGQDGLHKVCAEIRAMINERKKESN